MTVKELHELFQHFIDNDFKHLRSRVDWLLYGIIAGLFGIIANLIVLVIKAF